MVGIKKKIYQQVNTVTNSNTVVSLYSNSSSATEILRGVEGNWTGNGSSANAFAGIGLVRVPNGMTSTLITLDTSNGSEFYQDSSNTIWIHGFNNSGSANQHYCTEIYSLGEMTLNPGDTIYIVSASAAATAVNKYNLGVILSIEC